MLKRSIGWHTQVEMRYAFHLRLHLFEFNDLPWLPAFLREGLTRYLTAVYWALPPPREWAKLIAEAADRQGTSTIVDLCSGTGGPLELVVRELAALGRGGIRVIRTDLFPAAGVIGADARHVPKELAGVRTMFAAFHHFRAEDARMILRDARDRGTSICIFEVTRRAPLPLFAMLLSPLFALLLTPRIRPVRASQLLFTYLIPILPLMVGFDGFVSSLRTYTIEEFGRMAADLETPEYEWKCFDVRFPGLPFPFPALIGCPVRPSVLLPQT